MNKHKHRRRGMTLIEIIVVIAILALLMAAVTVYAIGIGDQARQGVARTDLQTLTQALDTYRAKTGRYPSKTEGLEVLVKTRVVKRTPRDPWGRAYLYDWRDDGPVVLTYGRDGAPGGEGLDLDLSSADGEATD